MSALDPILKPLRRFTPEALLNLRPAYPPVAIEVDGGQLALVRVRPARRARPHLEAFRVQVAPEHTVGASIFRPNLGSLEEMRDQVRELFARSGTKPGRVSLILPDNLAKVSIVTLPERPSTRKQLDELLRFKLRRSVPFRLEEAVLSSTILPGPGPEIGVLVAVMLRSVVEQFETAFEAAGARPGLVDLCTPSVFNLVRGDLLAATTSGSDAALLNCTRNYFTLVIAQAGRVVFFRCKSYAGGEDADAAARIAVMVRELASSFSYYQEKLSGAGIGTMFVRAVAPGLAEVMPALESLGIPAIRPVDASTAVVSSNGTRFAVEDGQFLAPALGAASGRAVA
jgi:type IV pilus assembly protein PilM